ncbi:MAG: DUF2314 domain-containing protein [Defluviitaleaceae bacterium]|nr:DUF2314 domain-containing protein [Defluviitaleaceae bacterium]
MERDDIVYTKAVQQIFEASKKAQDSFKYFWRELCWDRRRIVTALNLACVKAEFQQENHPNPPISEFMWIADVDFDGICVKGYLISSPHELTNIKQGDFVEIPLNEINDWLFAIDTKTYGGFTIQVMREEMGEEDRKAHDEAWGLDFGHYNKVLVAYQQDEHPENLIEHPMSINMKEKFEEFLVQHPNEVTHKDEAGYTMLHREAIAGNKTIVEVLMQMGADVNAKTNNGHTALDFAEKLKWEHLIPILRKAT